MGYCTWRVDTRFYHACPATYPIRPRRQDAGHSSIPDGSNPRRPFLAPYDDSTFARSSSGDPKSATSDQRRFQTRSPAWVRTSAHGGDNASDVAYRYSAQGNNRRQVDLRSPPGDAQRRCLGKAVKIPVVTDAASVAHASTVFASASRRNSFSFESNRLETEGVHTKICDREDALAGMRDARVSQRVAPWVISGIQQPPGSWRRFTHARTRLWRVETCLQHAS
jgi:hypothetical protein